MIDDLDYLLRPVKEGMCKYESLKDGTINLKDIKIMNAYLDVQAHNSYIEH